MAKQTFTTGQVLTAAQMNTLQTNDFNQTVSTKTDDYTFLAADKGTRVVANKASAVAFTVDNNVFDAGDTIWVHNINTGTLTLTAGAGVTLNTAGALTFAQWEGGVIYFTSAASAIVFRGGGVGAANFSDAATGTYTDGGINYKYITYTASGTLTVTEAGFADLLIVGGGGGGGNAAGAGAGGHLYITDAYLPTGSLTVTVGAGGGVGAVGITSRIQNYFVQGGGGGPTGANNGVIGGSGSAGVAAGVGAAGITDLGNAGGNGATNAGGGGGGAGGAGANAPSSGNGGNGGAGVSNSITGASVARAGGGGGGGTSSGGTASDGGGAGSTTQGSNGSANTGGGGGAGFSVGHGTGGSGVVIIRVKV